MIKKKKVAALCKKNYTITMTTRSDRTQWVGNGTALYSMEGMPKMTPEEVAVAFDYSDAERKAMTLNENRHIADLTVDDYPGEMIIEIPPRDIIIGSTHYMMFTAANTVMFIDSAALAPVEFDSQTNFFMRCIDGNEEYKFLCIKQGLLAQAIVIATVISRERIDEWVVDMYNTINSIKTGYKCGGDDGGEPDQLLLDNFRGEACEWNG